MNQAFRIIWSHARQAFVVADELASARGKRGGARLLLAAAVSAGVLGAGPAVAVDFCTSSNHGFGFPVIGSCDLEPGASLEISAPNGSITNSLGAAVTAPWGFNTISNAGLI